jgi:signal peptidase I
LPQPCGSAPRSTPSAWSGPQPCPDLAIVIGFYAFWYIIAGQARSKLIEYFQIPTDSMYPSFVVGDHVFVTKLDHTYGRGQVIALRYPLDPAVVYMKRIVALGGDRVEIRNDTLIEWGGCPAHRNCATVPGRGGRRVHDLGRDARRPPL